MKSVGLVVLAGLLLLILTTGAVSARTNRDQATPVKLSADLSCVESGGAGIAFTVQNIGKRTLTIDGDFHLTLFKVLPGGQEFAGAAFVFPAPEFEVIAPGSQKTFLVPIGTAEEDEPGTDLSAKRLLLEAEVFFEGRKQPARRHFSFAGCGP